VGICGVAEADLASSAASPPCPSKEASVGCCRGCWVTGTGIGTGACAGGGLAAVDNFVT
jgi:hypothetical protein